MSSVRLPGTGPTPKYSEEPPCVTPAGLLVPTTLRADVKALPTDQGPADEEEAASCAKVASLQQQLDDLQSHPVVVLHQTRDALALLCSNVKILLSGTAPSDPPAWLQEFQCVNDLRVLAEKYLEAFLAVKGKTP